MVHGSGRIKHLRTPFCLAFTKTPDCYRDGKLAPQAEACLHLGYSRTRPGYVLQVLEGPRKGRVITASQVKFREDVFPMRERDPHARMEPTLWYDIIAPQHDEDDDAPRAELPDDTPEPDPTEGAHTDDPDPDDDDVEPRTRSMGDLGDWRTVYQGLGDLHRRIRSDRSTQSLQLYTPTPSAPGDPKWAPKRFAQIVSIDDEQARKTWIDAHHAENDGQFAKPDVPRMVPTPRTTKGADLMHLHTIYSVESDGRKKARTVLGAGKDKLDSLDLGYECSFSPTARNTTVRLHCAYAAAHGLIIRGGDVTQAFCQGEWPTNVKKVLARMPDGYNTYYHGVHHCCEVGNLYGHPIAGRNWYHTLCKRMAHHGLEKSQHDTCLFHKYADGDELHIVLYVDDILSFSPRPSDMYAAWKSWFDDEFTWTDFDTNLHEFTSISIAQIPDQVSLSMHRYITDMAREHFPAGGHRSYSLPADLDLPKAVAKAAQDRDTTYADTETGKTFRRLVMQLLYASYQARPDIAAAADASSCATHD